MLVHLHHEALMEVGNASLEGEPSGFAEVQVVKMVDRNRHLCRRLYRELLGMNRSILGRY